MDEYYELPFPYFMEYRVKNKSLLYPDLCFKVNGVLFDVYNTLGPGHKEKYYHKGIEEGFRKNNINYRHEVKAPLVVYNKEVGKYYIDFLVESKIVVEVKRGKTFKRCDIEQILSYLVAMDLELGLLVIFKPDEVKIKRIINWSKVQGDNSNNSKNS